MGGAKLAAMAPAANAAIIDFLAIAYLQTPTYSEDGFSIVATNGDVLVADLAPGAAKSEIVPNNPFGSAGLVWTRDGGGAYDINGFSLELFTGAQAIIPVVFVS